MDVTELNGLPPEEREAAVNELLKQAAERGIARENERVPNGALLVRRLLDIIAKYIVVSDEQRLAIALWVMHTHCVEHFDQTPYLTVTSPERQCGKSRLLEVLELLVPRSWMTVTPSEAVIYRTIDATTPTLLLDEVDAIFAPKTADRYEGLRAILNAGHRKGAEVPRCVGPTQQVAMFKVFCAKVLAGIGVLPDTITDRSIPIRLQRKTREEKVARFRMREAKVEFEPLANDLAAWAEEHGAAMGMARPDLPDELSDRMQEGCEPLLAIADACGYGSEAREALVELLAGSRVDERESAQLRLLTDIRAVFDRLPNVAALHTSKLVQELNGDGWGNWYGRGLTAQDLASMLRPYGVASKNVRSDGGVQGQNAIVAKGYARDDFHEAWNRYLVTAVTPVTPIGEDVSRGESAVNASPADDDPSPNGKVTGVTGAPNLGQLLIEHGGTS